MEITAAEDGSGTEDEKEIVTGKDETGGRDEAAWITTENEGGVMMERESAETGGGVKEAAETETVGEQGRSKMGIGQDALNAERGQHDGTVMIG